MVDIDHAHRRLDAVEKKIFRLEQSPAPTVPQYDLSTPSYYIGNDVWIFAVNNTAEFVRAHNNDYPLPYAFLDWLLSNDYGGSFFNAYPGAQGWNYPSMAIPPFNTGSSYSTNMADHTWHHVHATCDLFQTGNRQFPAGIGPYYDYHAWHSRLEQDHTLAIETVDGTGGDSSSGAPIHWMFADVDPWIMLPRCVLLWTTNQYIQNLRVTADGTSWFHNFSDGTFGPFSTIDGGWEIVDVGGGNQVAHGRYPMGGYLYRDFPPASSSISIEFDFNSGNTQS